MALEVHPKRRVEIFIQMAEAAADAGAELGVDAYEGGIIRGLITLLLKDRESFEKLREAVTVLHSEVEDQDTRDTIWKILDENRG